MVFITQMGNCKKDLIKKPQIIICGFFMPFNLYSFQLNIFLENSLFIKTLKE
ncbi:MAG: hypothetical protein RI883_2186 [Bacteroidota bacterium]|jgi:hypothetical protein